MCLTYLVLTFPLLFVAPDASTVIWRGIFIRLCLIPWVIFSRHKLVFLDQSAWESSFTLPLVKRSVSCKSYYQTLAALLDLYGILTCVYIYAEDGKLIANIRNTKDFWDPWLKRIDATVFDIPVNIGLGSYIRNLTPPLFDKILGEYLSFCYFFFYFILVGSWLLVWQFGSKREHFDQTAAAIAMTYLFCEACFLIMPAAGPYWTYDHPKASEVGYLFSYITHVVVEGGSSSGTAFPSSHCAITTAAWVSMIMYLPRVGLAYILVCPGLWVATVWCGFHYGIDSIVGIAVGALCTALANAFARLLPYHAPTHDDKYSMNFVCARSVMPTYMMSSTNTGFMEENEYLHESMRDEDTLLGTEESVNANIRRTAVSILVQEETVDDSSPLLPNLHA
eukprot:CFRG1510T1